MKEIDKVINKCCITFREDNIEKTIIVDIIRIPHEKYWLGKKVGETITKSSGKKCVIIKIESEELPPPSPPLPPPPGPWPKLPERAPFPAYTYEEVEKKFGISIRGFGKGINVTSKSIVLISVVGKDINGFVYHDYWVDEGVYSYSGEGKYGDQKFEKGNLALRNAAIDGKDIHLLIKFSSKEYYYQGVFGLIDYKFEIEKDANGIPRKEIKFIIARDD